MTFKKHILIGTLGFWCVPALSGTMTSSVAAMAEVTASCQMNGGTLDFGAYDPVSANAASPLSGQGSFSIVCTKGTTAVISINTGQNGSHATGTTRAMSSGSGYLSYELYTAANLSTVWSGSNTVQYLSTSKNATNTISVWGQIPAGQNVPGGVVYNDVVTVTASF